MSYKKPQIIGFFVLASIVGLVVAMMFWPFWQMLVLAGIISVMFSPLHKKLLDKYQKPILATSLTVGAVLVILILPLWLVGQLLFNELVKVYQSFRLGNLSFASEAFSQRLPESLQHLLVTLNNDFSSMVSKFSSNAFDFISSMLSNVAGFFLSLFLLIFMVYYFLRDRERIRALVVDLSPITTGGYEHVLLMRLEAAISGVVKGAFLTALIQGFCAFIGFWIFGVPSPVLWGAVTVLAALVPNVGTSLALVPAVLYLLISGHTGAGIGLGIYGALIVGTIDNIVGPKLIGNQAKLHPLLVLLSVLGGIQLFGFLGFLFGPIILSVLVTLVDIYRGDLKPQIDNNLIN